MRYFVIPSSVLLVLAADINGERRAVAEPPKTATQLDRAGDPLPAGALARLGTVRFRGQGRLLGFLPGGKSLVTLADQDGTIQLWEPETGRPVTTIGTKSLIVRSASLSADGKQIAVAGSVHTEPGQPRRGIIRVLDLATGNEVRAWDRDWTDMTAAAVALAPDGKLLATVGREGIVRIYEVASGAELLTLLFPGDIAAYLAFSPDGTVLAVGCGPNARKAFLWNWQAGAEPRPLPIGERAPISFAFSPDGKTLAGGSDIGPESVKLWEVKTGRLLHRLVSPHGGTYGSSVTFSPDGKLLASVDHGNRRGQGFSGGAELWDPATGKYKRYLPTPGQGVATVVFSPDSRLLVGWTGSSFHVWDMQADREVGADDTSHRAPVSRIAVAKNGLVATACDDHTIRLWDLATGQHLRKLTHRHLVRAIALSPDGARLVSSSLDDTVTIWDTATGKTVYKLPGHGEMGGRRSVGFAPDGKRAFSFGDDFYLRVWDLANGKALLEHAVRPGGVKVPDENSDDRERERFFIQGESAFAPDGKTLMVCTFRDFFVFDVASGRELRKIPGEGSHIISLAVSPDGKLLLASAWGKPFQWTTPDGRTHSSSAKNHPVCLWDLSSGKLVHQQLVPVEGAGPVAFSTDGKHFAAGTDRPAQIYVWETATRKHVRRFEGLGKGIRSLAFSPDGRCLVAGLEDTTALVLDLSAPTPKNSERRKKGE